MQERLETYFSFEGCQIGNPGYEPQLESKRMKNIIIEIEKEWGTEFSLWKIHNEAKQTKYCNLLLVEQQFEKDPSKLITQILKSQSQNIWAFHTRPKLSVDAWMNFFKESEFKHIGLVFITYPERTNMKNKDVKNKNFDM